MKIQRLFTSNTQNPKFEATITPGGVNGTNNAAQGLTTGPSGVLGGAVANCVPQIMLGQVKLPTIPDGGGILVQNNGTAAAGLYYDDSLPNGSPTWTNAARSAGGPRAVIAPGNFVILTDTVVGPIMAYTGGPLSICAGIFQFAVLLDSPDHPNATVKF